MTNERIIEVVQADIDGTKVVRQHKEYCGKYWSDNNSNDWDFVNYYYRVLKVGEVYKNSNNKTLTYEKSDSL